MAQRGLLVLPLGLLWSLAGQPTWGGEPSANFSVLVRVKPPASVPSDASSSRSPGPRSDSGSGVCGSSLTRSVVSIGCPGQGPSTPLQVMAFTNRETQVSTFDVYSGGARILGWQVLSLDDREYLEMTLGW